MNASIFQSLSIIGENDDDKDDLEEEMMMQEERKQAEKDRREKYRVKEQEREEVNMEYL